MDKVLVLNKDIKYKEYLSICKDIENKILPDYKKGKYSPLHSWFSEYDRLIRFYLPFDYDSFKKDYDNELSYFKNKDIVLEQKNIRQEDNSVLVKDLGTYTQNLTEYFMEKYMSFDLENMIKYDLKNKGFNSYLVFLCDNYSIDIDKEFTFLYKNRKIDLYDNYESIYRKYIFVSTIIRKVEIKEIPKELLDLSDLVFKSFDFVHLDNLNDYLEDNKIRKIPTNVIESSRIYKSKYAHNYIDMDYKYQLKINYELNSDIKHLVTIFLIRYLKETVAHDLHLTNYYFDKYIYFEFYSDNLLTEHILKLNETLNDSNLLFNYIYKLDVTNKLNETENKTYIVKKD